MKTGDVGNSTPVSHAAQVRFTDALAQLRSLSGAPNAVPAATIDLYSFNDQPPLAVDIRAARGRVQDARFAPPISVAAYNVANFLKTV